MHHLRVVHHAPPLLLLVAVQDQELQRRVGDRLPRVQQRVHLLPPPRLHQHANDRLVVVVTRLDARRPTHLVQHLVRQVELVAPRVQVDQRVVEEGRARQAVVVELLHEAQSLLQLLAQSAHDDQPRVGRAVRLDALAAHVAVDRHRVLEPPRVPRRHQHRLVRVLVRTRPVPRVARPAHEVERRQRRRVVLGLGAGGDERRERVLVGLDAARLHVTNELLRLRHVAQLRAARHQRGVRVLAEDVPAGAQRVEEGNHHLQLLVVLDVGRLRDAGEERAGAHGACRKRTRLHVLEKNLELGAGRELRTAGRH